MKKIILLYLTTGLISSFCFSQNNGKTGINTMAGNNPSGVFHVDGQANTPSNTTTNSTVTTDDVIVDTSGNMGIGTIAPKAKLDVQASTGTSALRMDDGTSGANLPDGNLGKIIVSNAAGDFKWDTKPAADVKQGSIKLLPAGSGTEGTTVAPDLRGRLTTVGDGRGTGSRPNANAIRISSETPIELVPGKWLIQAKYTTRTTGGAGSYGWCNANGSAFYVWTMLVSSDTSTGSSTVGSYTTLTTVGAGQERSGFCMCTPQLTYIYDIPAGGNKYISLYASTSTANSVIVYRDGDGYNAYGAPFFTAIRLDAFN